MKNKTLNLVDRHIAFTNFLKLNTNEPVISEELSEQIREFLDKVDFFRKPAAIKYHGNYTGGLFDHSLAVAETLVKMTNEFGIKCQNPRSPYIVGLFHDLCKTEDYINTNEDKLAPATWQYNNDKLLKGHGDKSIMMLSQLITLTEEEVLCIRYHMGAYETEEWNEYDKAIKKYETVLWTHTADMYASKVMGI